MLVFHLCITVLNIADSGNILKMQADGIINNYSLGTGFGLAECENIL